jgi:hypothetical protein
VCRSKHVLIALLGDGTLAVQEEDRQNNSFSLGTCHVSILDSEEEEEEEEEEEIAREPRLLRRSVDILCQEYLNPNTTSSVLSVLLVLIKTIL